MENYLYWIWLAELKKVPTQNKKKWLKEIGHPKRIFENAKDLGIDKDLCMALDIANANLKLNIKTLTPDDPLHRKHMPDVIYYQGTPFKGRQAAVVGTRDSSIHGEYYTEFVCESLIRNKTCINSGLAKGIDLTAHMYALRNEAPTQAFLAHGLDKCYPPEHSWYKDQIVENGAVFSIYPVGTPPLRHHFLQRNQLLVTFSDQVIVIEAPLKSGSINTAMHAWDQMKPVCTIEGTDSKRCAGNRQLLKGGAIPLKVPAHYWRGPEREYIEAIRDTPMSFRKLKSKFPRDSGDLDRVLWDLESHGWITHKADGKWHYNGW